MPSVLIETGFLSTDTDENYLMKKENQQEMASTILKAFTNYKREMEDNQEPVISTAEDKTTKTVVKNPDDAKAPTTTKGSLEVAYRIQVAASSKSTVDARYHSIEDLEVIKEGDMYKFLVGYFSSAEAARPRLAALKANGFEGAFIVAYKDGQRIKA